MKKTIIIGAGIAGISAAVELSRNNHKPIIIEQRKFPGGRTFSFRDEYSGDIIDNGQHLLVGAYANFLSLLDILGTKKNLLFTKGIKIPFIDKNSNQTYFNTEIFPSKLGLLLGLINFNCLSLRSKWQAIRFFMRIRNNVNDFSGYNVTDLFEYYQLPYDLINNFLEPLCLATMNAKPKDASAEIFIQVITKVLFSNNNYSTLIYPATGLSELVKPFEKIISKVGGEVHYSTGIDDIIHDGTKIVAVQSKSQIFHGDYFIFAIPPNKIAEIFTKSEITQDLSKYSKFRFSPIISIYLWFDKDFIDSKIVGVLNSPIQWIFNKRKIFNNENFNKGLPGHYAITISGADEMINFSKEKILKICTEEITRLFPDCKSANLKHSVVIKEKNATVLLDPASLPCREIDEKPFTNIFIAGDWRDTGLPATIESACLSGFQAAKKIIESDK